MINYNKAFALPNEIWEDVRGYEGLYKVSTMGRVKSLNYNKTGKEKILKPVKNNVSGYLYVSLSKDGKRKNHYTHRLVAEAFLKPVAGKDHVNHLSEVKDSNHYSNLEWCDRKYNANFGTAIQRRVKKTSKIVYQYTLDGKKIKEYPSAREVHRQTGYSQGNISACCRGLYKQAYGFKWSYK